jgi:hypothetical protein
MKTSRIIRLAIVISLFIIVSCDMHNHSISSKLCNKQQHEVWLSAANISYFDTAALAKIIIDDSLYLNQIVRPRKSSSSYFQKVFKLCEGSHRISTQFGHYSKDTTFSVKGDISLFVSMNHWPKYPSYNGIVVAQIARDGDPNHNAID